MKTFIKKIIFFCRKILTILGEILLHPTKVSQINWDNTNRTIEVKRQKLKTM